MAGIRTLLLLRVGNCNKIAAKILSEKLCAEFTFGFINSEIGYCCKNSFDGIRLFRPDTLPTELLLRSVTLVEKAGLEPATFWFIPVFC